MRKRRRKNNKRKIVITASICLLFVMTIGYAAFQTNINITVKGNIKSQTVAQQIIDNGTVTTGDGLYEDTYEEGRYFYKGANPDNYITFNNETWRIISAEKDGTIKIMKKDSIGTKTYNSANSVDWSGPVDLNIYLNNEADENSYYNILSTESQALIVSHTWNIGGAYDLNRDLAGHILDESKKTWDGKIGLISVSEVLRANTNMDGCGTLRKSYDNSTNCKSTNYMYIGITFFSLTPNAQYSDCFFRIGSRPISNNITIARSGNVLPVLYLKSDITLSGSGTETDPYTIN